MNWRFAVTLSLGTLELDVALEGDIRPVALMGPNGAGKTTLLRVLAGARRPNAGRIEVNGRLLFDSETLVERPPEERRVGFVPQGFGLFPHLRVVDNVAFGRLDLPRADRRRLARERLEEMDCGDLADRRPSMLSGGETQRVALARALLAEPDMLLLDEPLSALDVVARRTLRRYLADHLRQHARPALVVTHDVRDVLALDARVYVIEGGRVAQSGTAAELAAHPATPFIAELFDAPTI